MVQWTLHSNKSLDNWPPLGYDQTSTKGVWKVNFSVLLTCAQPRIWTGNVTESVILIQTGIWIVTETAVLPQYSVRLTLGWCSLVVMEIWSVNESALWTLSGASVCACRYTIRLLWERTCAGPVLTIVKTVTKVLSVSRCWFLYGHINRKLRCWIEKQVVGERRNPNMHCNHLIMRGV